ncbi:MAG: DNA polymerase III subunit gamma/tau [Proteobacteria bacterium]|nr:DNA polymerase III subunit gamma/tau [Pseudomonadota bacterium]MBU1688352.1 DNA polymerase III subunit gamma/tau [Pseudomonadota bacterium]
MSYLVLARKWRPQTFDQVVGQGPVVRILRNALKRNRVPHAMLFGGVRGVGKTTLARIMAKALNCQGTSETPPCDECESCREIKAGASIDLHEIDGASNRGIQEIRDLKENIRFLPTKCRFKIIIIDEVHMLTAEAFNALLKTLEEPPAHVVFMFATTELHKIPVTILSRCQRYELKRVPFAELFAFFKKIAGAEGVSISDDALEMIAREASGSVRDGLSLLDQIFSFGEGEMTDDDVREVLGLVGRQVYEQLAVALLNGDLAGSLSFLDQVCQAGADLKRFATDLLLFFRGLVICRVVPAPGELLDGSDRELTSLTTLAAHYETETVLNLFDQLLKGLSEMQYASHPRLVLEMTFARALQVGQVVPVADLIGKLDQLLQQDGFELPQGPQKGFVASTRLVEQAVSVDIEVPPVVPPAEAAKVPEPLSVDEPVVEAPSPDQGPVMVAESVPTMAQDSSAKSSRDVRRDWDEFIEYVKDRRKWMAPVMKMCVGISRQGQEIFMKYDEPAECRMLQESENLKSLTEFAQDFFQEELQIRVKIRGGGEGATPGDIDGPQEERRALRDDPLVQMVAEVFGGRVDGIRTGPRSRVVTASQEEEQQ